MSVLVDSSVYPKEIDVTWDSFQKANELQITFLNPATNFLSFAYSPTLDLTIGCSGTMLTTFYPNGVTSTSKPSNTPYTLYSVKWLSDKFFVVGDNNAFYSEDGLTWTLANLGASSNARDIASSGSLYVVVGTSGQIRYSSNGTTWSSTSSSTTAFNSIAYGAGLFVAVANSGVIKTSDNGINWTTRTSGTSRTLNSIVYENGQFIAVGDVGTVIRSVDGITWTTSTTVTDNIEKIIWDSIQLRYLICTAIGNVLSSTDGITWTAHTVVPGSSFINAIGFGSSGYFVGVVPSGDNGVTSVYQSSDLISWEVKIHGGDYYGACYSPNLDMYVVVGNGASILISSDKKTWVKMVSPVYRTLYSVIYANGIFVITGTSGTILTSADGITWINRNTYGWSGTHNSVAFGNGVFVIVGESVVRRSVDGINWTDVNTSWNINRIVYSETLKLFVIASDAGKIATSPDGQTWTSVTSGTANNLLSLMFAKGEFWAGQASTNERLVLRSSTGETWTTVDTGLGDAASPITACAGNDSTLVFAGGKITASSHPNTWITVPNSEISNSGIRHIIWDGESFFGVGPSGLMLELK